MDVSPVVFGLACKLTPEERTFRAANSFAINEILENDHRVSVVRDLMRGNPQRYVSEQLSLLERSLLRSQRAMMEKLSKELEAWCTQCS